MISIMIVGSDAGELFAITSAELNAVGKGALVTQIEVAVDEILDARAIAKGEYDPSLNGEEFVVIGPDYDAG